MTDSTPAARQPYGWELVRSAFLAAPDRTLTNVDLGAIRGVQAFHQRISDLKRRGYVFTQGVKVADGYYAYHLIGAMENTQASGAGEGLPLIHDAQVTAAQSAAAEGIKAHPPTINPTPSDPAPASSSVAVDVIAAHRDRIAELEQQADRVSLALGGAEIGQDDGLPFEVATMFAAYDECFREMKAAADTLADAFNHRYGLTGDDAIDHGMALSYIVPRVVEALNAPTITTPKPRAARQPREARSGMTGPKAMAEVLEAEGKPMHSKAIAERVLAAHPDLYGGKTPAATMNAQLSTANVKGGDFVKVSPGCFGLRAWDAAKLAQEPTR